MASLFTGETGLRHKYYDKTEAAIDATTGKADALLLCTFKTAGRLCYMFNSCALDLSLWLVHPNRDGSVAANRLLWMEFPAQYNINYEAAAVNLEFDPGSKLYISKASGTAGATGKFRIIYWG